MGGFRFYHIQEKYINFLHSGDSRVQFNKGQRRPYVGIVLVINNIKYYVPLESPKPNHGKIRSGGPVLKLDEGRLGLMGFNNMIPVPDCALVYFDFNDVEDIKYRNLLINQLNYCNGIKEIIINRANTTYQKAVSGKVPLYNKVCCNYKKLEGMAVSYNPDYRHRKRAKIHNR